MSSTHTYVILELSKAAFEEIKSKLEEADYEHQFHTNDKHPDGPKLIIDMHGIAVAEEENKVSISQEEAIKYEDILERAGTVLTDLPLQFTFLDVRSAVNTFIRPVDLIRIAGMIIDPDTGLRFKYIRVVDPALNLGGKGDISKGTWTRGPLDLALLRHRVLLEVIEMSLDTAPCKIEVVSCL